MFFGAPTILCLHSQSAATLPQGTPQNLAASTVASSQSGARTQASTCPRHPTSHKISRCDAIRHSSFPPGGYFRMANRLRLSRMYWALTTTSIRACLV